MEIVIRVDEGGQASVAGQTAGEPSPGGGALPPDLAAAVAAGANNGGPAPTGLGQAMPGQPGEPPAHIGAEAAILAPGEMAGQSAGAAPGSSSTPEPEIVEVQE